MSQEPFGILDLDRCGSLPSRHRRPATGSLAHSFTRPCTRALGDCTRPWSLLHAGRLDRVCEPRPRRRVPDRAPRAEQGRKPAVEETRAVVYLLAVFGEPEDAACHGPPLFPV